MSLVIKNKFSNHRTKYKSFEKINLLFIDKQQVDFFKRLDVLYKE